MTNSVDGLFSLIISDIAAHYKTRAKWRIVFCSLINPSIHACVLIRLCQRAPRFLFWFWRNVLILKHSIDCGRGVDIGQGLNLPHPIGIVIGQGGRVGNNVTIYQNVTIGTKKGKYPQIKDNVILYPNCVVVGDIIISENSIIGAGAFCNKNLSPGEVFYGR